MVTTLCKLSDGLTSSSSLTDGIDGLKIKVNLYIFNVTDNCNLNVPFKFNSAGFPNLCM